MLNKSELDLTLNISGDGVITAAYDENDNVIAESLQTWSDILDEEIDAFCNSKGEIVVDALDDGVEHLQRLIRDIHNVADLLEEKIRKRKVFVRFLIAEGRATEEATVSFSRFMRGEY